MLRIKWHCIQASFLLTIVATSIDCVHYAYMQQDRILPVHVHESTLQFTIRAWKNVLYRVLVKIFHAYLKILVYFSFSITQTDLDYHSVDADQILGKFLLVVNGDLTIITVKLVLLLHNR